MPRIENCSVDSLSLAGLGLMAVLLSFSIFPAFAQERVDIRFKPGASSTTINGAIRGDEYIDYVVNARGGQTMVVSLAVTDTNGHGSAYFNILPAGQHYGGPYTGSSDDDRRAEITVPHDGDWAIRAYLMGNDRDADKTVGYSLDVYIAPSKKRGRRSLDLRSKWGCRERKWRSGQRRAECSQWAWYKPRYRWCARKR